MFRISRQLIEKILLTLIALLSFHAGLKAQCHAEFNFTVDSIQGVVSCTNTSVIGNTDSPVVYTWYEIPGNVLSNSVNPNIGLSDGPHSLCLKMVNGGCADSFCVSLTMPTRYCKANFSYTVNNNTGDVQFSNQSIGSGNSYIWSFGDDISFSTDADPVHTFNTGWYYTCLNIRNNDSTCSDVICHFIRVQKPSPSPCIADFNFEYDSLNSKTVHFSNQTVSDSSISVIWLFPNEQKDTTGQPTFTFDSVGNYTVCMLVSGPLCADSVCKTVEIIEIIPVCEANFSYQLFADTSESGGLRIAVFDNQSDGNNLAYKWWVNDSLVSEEENPVYYYPENGLYTVCLEAYSTNGCSDSTCQLIRITSKSSGINDIDGGCSVLIAPNPASAEILVDLTSCKDHVQYICVYDFLGNQLLKQIPDRQATKVSLVNLTKGIYIIEIKTDRNLLRKKLSKL